MERACDALHDSRFFTSKSSSKGIQRYNLRGSVGDMTLLNSDPKQDDRQSEDSPSGDMVWIPGGTFRMGSDKHYPDEAPVHRVTVDGFGIDRTPVTNRQFKDFVRATGHITFAEIPPDPKDYPGALAAHALCRFTCVLAARRVRSICATGANGGSS